MKVPLQFASVAKAQAKKAVEIYSSKKKEQREKQKRREKKSISSINEPKKRQE